MAFDALILGVARTPGRARALLMHAPPDACPTHAASPDARSGNDYYNELAEDLSEEALAWVESSNDDLIRAPHPPVVKQVEGAPAAEEPLDGELVVVEDD